MIDKIKITALSGRGSITMQTRDYSGYWLGRVDWGQATGAHQAYTAFNRVGEFITSTSLGSRAISIPGWVIEDSADTLQKRCDVLNAFFSPVEDYELEYQGRTINFRPDSSVIYSRDERNDNKIVRKFLIQGTCPFPLFSNAAETVVPFDASTKMFRFPTDFGQAAPVVFGSVQQLYNSRIINPGGFAAGATIQIHFLGAVTSPKIRDVQTNQAIGVDKSFAAGDRLTICTVAGKKSITVRHEDLTEENYIKYRSLDTVWLQLEPGANIWAIECSEQASRANMRVTIMFTPLYLEVD